MSANINSLFCNSCSIDLSDPPTLDVARNTLDEISQDLAKDVYLRQRMGKSEPPLWPVLHHLWHTCVETLNDDEYEPMLKPLIPSLARFTRNLVAAVPHNQSRAFDDEPKIRKMLFAYTSYYAIKDDSSHTTTILLAQTISNIVTANEELLSRLWTTYMDLPEEQSIITRMLTSPDTRSILSALVMMLNSIHASPERAKLMTTKPIGLRICIGLLDRMVLLHDVEEHSDGGRAFEIGYGIFARLIDFGLLPDLYTEIAVEDEIITPHQTVLLKLLDSHLQTSQLSVELCQQLSPMIASTFFDLSEYADHAIDRALPQEPPSAPPPLSASSSTPGDAPPPTTPITPPDNRSPTDMYTATSPKPEPEMSMGELDMLLPQVCEALVLVTQCLITLALTSGDPEYEFPDSDNPKDFFNSAMVDESQGLCESIIGLLKRLDRFLPRIMFGKPVDLSSLHLPSGIQPPAQSGSSFNTSTANGDDDEGPAKRGFAYLKRDLVRLLGILCSSDTSVQDRVRLCGGIPVVMNLCVVDDRNPYLREHAIFALHNLLEGNAENQAIVDSIRPVVRNNANLTVPS